MSKREEEEKKKSCQDSQRIGREGKIGTTKEKKLLEMKTMSTIKFAIYIVYQD